MPRLVDLIDKLRSATFISGIIGSIIGGVGVVILTSSSTWESIFSVWPSELPIGSVIAVQNPECGSPEWRRFSEADGKFIIASSQNIDKLRYLASGGNAEITIYNDNLPRTVFTVFARKLSVGSSGAFVMDIGNGKQDRQFNTPINIGSIGPENGIVKPIPLFPPFIALTYCIKVR